MGGREYSRSWCGVLLLAFLAGGCSPEPEQDPSLPPSRADHVYHVYPGQKIQPALDAAAADDLHKIVRVHTGVYRPSLPGQAMIWFNARHDGITLEADGDVVLTAANEKVADVSSSSYPAIVNHVIYLGDAISRNTVVQGFTITGANGFVTTSDEPGPIETSEGLEKGLFYYLDGGAIKLVGRCYPTFRNLVIRDNVTSLCGGGVSIEHQGHSESAAHFQDCIFKNNRCPATGPAIDVLNGSAVVIENCLFVENIGNTGMSGIRQKYGLSYNWEHGSGALTVFPESNAQVRRCTFVNNWNGVDDHGSGSTYQDCIFWNNSADDGSRPGGPYEFDILDASAVRNCYLSIALIDLRGTINADDNHFDAPNPQFNEKYHPQAAAYMGVGYRPAESHSAKELDHVLRGE